MEGERKQRSFEKRWLELFKRKDRSCKTMFTVNLSFSESPVAEPDYRGYAGLRLDIRKNLPSERVIMQ